MKELTRDILAFGIAFAGGLGFLAAIIASVLPKDRRPR